MRWLVYAIIQLISFILIFILIKSSQPVLAVMLFFFMLFLAPIDC